MEIIVTNTNTRKDTNLSSATWLEQKVPTINGEDNFEVI